jgi:hypothetical protein
MLRKDYDRKCSVEEKKLLVVSLKGLACRQDELISGKLPVVK